MKNKGNVKIEGSFVNGVDCPVKNRGEVKDRGNFC